MTWQDSLEIYGLVPGDESLPAIRQMLACEVEMERSEYPEEREEDLALLCCVQLFSRGYLEDVLCIWEAKQSGMDLACSLDGHFLLGAGVEQTKSYLTDNPSPEASAILEYIASLEQCGMLVDWSPPKHLESYREYFQTRTDAEA